MGFTGSGVNLYAYVGNSPANGTDPSGLDDALLGAGGGFVGGIGGGSGESFEEMLNELSPGQVTELPGGVIEIQGGEPFGEAASESGGQFCPYQSETGATANPLVTAHSEAVFWSGIEGQDTAATAWAMEHGGQTLEMTLETHAITLPEYDRANPASVDAWRQASEEFAQGAEGDVTVLQESDVRINSVWAKTEYKALIDNPKVTSITAVNPQTGQSTVIWRRP